MNPDKTFTVVVINSPNNRIADKKGKEKRYTKTGFTGTNT
jgi:hypothetical protein